MSELIFRYQTEGVSILVNSSIYSREAVLKAAYWFTDRCHILVGASESGALDVQIRLKKDGDSLEEIAGEFANSLLDHQLRQEISAETEPVRALIVAKAFAEAGLLEDDPIPGEIRDPVQVKTDSLIQIGNIKHD
jgi:His-Xaa-Ser system protein HxsD